MANYSSFVADIERAETIHDKSSLLSVILYANKKMKLSELEKKELTEFAHAEIGMLLKQIPAAASYEAKDQLFDYKNNLLGSIMLCYASPAEIPAEKLNEIKALVELVNRERFIEVAIDGIFENKQYDAATVNQLLCMVAPLKDEYQKSMLYQGLLHYRDNISELPTETRVLFADYICADLERYLNMSLNEQLLNILEVICDVAKHFINDRVIAQLKNAFKLEQSNVSFYAMGSLLSAGQEIPASVVTALANDLVYADGTYGLLQSHGLTALFPTELATPEYLAKSDLVHWLTYPTELGQVPDRIEYLGRVKKKEIYHIFRYMSNSDTLSDDLKNRWLIGWANDEGGTFSNFDPYDQFEQKNIEKTLKVIKRKLL